MTETDRRASRRGAFVDGSNDPVATRWRDLPRAFLGDLGGLTPPSWVGPPPPLSNGLRMGLLVGYYALVLAGLLAVYAVKPPSPPPFIYQGF